MKARISILISILLFTGVILFTPVTPVLVITNRKNPSQKYFSRSGYKNGFVISYTHSVNKGRVHDYYECNKDGSLVLTKTHFVSYGAGIPEPEETKGADFTVLDNGYLINNLNRQLSKLVMAVGIIANHTFATCSYGNEKIGEPLQEVPFTNYFAPQTSIILDIKRVNLVEYIFNNQIGEPHGRFRK